METTAKPANPYRISLNAWRRDNGYSSGEDFLALLGDLTCDSIAPALCRDGCEVEPDGRCSHGCPSLLLAAGIV